MEFGQSKSSDSMILTIGTTKSNELRYDFVYELILFCIELNKT